jgi:hypothetical protein
MTFMLGNVKLTRKKAPFKDLSCIQTRLFTYKNHYKQCFKKQKDIFLPLNVAYSWRTLA